MEMSERDEHIQSLRDVIDFLEEHPELPLPSRFSVCTFDEPETLDLVKKVARELKSFEKSETDVTLSLTKPFGRTTLDYIFYRESVCQRVVVGKRQVKKQVPPPGVKTVTEIVEEDIVEWSCPPLLDTRE